VDRSTGDAERAILMRRPTRIRPTPNVGFMTVGSVDDYPSIMEISGKAKEGYAYFWIPDGARFTEVTDDFSAFIRRHGWLTQLSIPDLWHFPVKKVPFDRQPLNNEAVSANTSSDRVTFTTVGCDDLVVRGRSTQSATLEVFIPRRDGNRNSLSVPFPPTWDTLVTRDLTADEWERILFSKPVPSVISTRITMGGTDGSVWLGVERK